MRKPLLAITLIAVALGVRHVAGQTPDGATVVVKVPEDARVYFDGTLTEQTGPTRSFGTPSLEVGKSYLYSIRAEVVRGGKTVALTKRVRVRAGATTTVDFGNMETEAGDAARLDPGWPRKLVRDGDTLTVYQPQLERWDRNRLTGRAAVSLVTRASPQPTFGVVWLEARTDVDRETRIVTLDDLKVTKVNFPTAEDKSAQYLGMIRDMIPTGTRTMALDRLQANLAVTAAEARAPRVELKNEPPQVLVSTRPAILILIDGRPALRQVKGSKLMHVINTNAAILFDPHGGKYYLHLLDRWLEAKAIEGPWAAAPEPPAELDDVLQVLGEGPNATAAADLAPDVKETIEQGVIPTIFVSTAPAELIEIDGEPDLAPIDGTKLLWVRNSASQIVLDQATQDYYVLLSGRWFRSKKLKEGPWEFVAGDQVPADLKKIPETHPKGDVLAAVAGTPQAHEAAIANSIPQTATIQRADASIAPIYDGAPQFQPIAGTNLNYAVNSPTPIIQTAPSAYYAVENGVWFTAGAPQGPWDVATSVPAPIYAIPASSPLYYVTYAQVYGYTPDVVYVGYLPGYFGTCLAPWGSVVYGTGWRYRPWLGNYWFGRPWSYGYAAGFRWNSVGGWSFGFAGGYGHPWWGPVGWHSGWGGTWRTGWSSGWGGRYANVHNSNVHINNFNVYNRWPTRALAPRSTTVHAARTTTVGTTVHTARGINNVYAGRDGHVYRQNGAGWEQHTTQGWRSSQELPAAGRQQFERNQQQLNAERQARRFGEIQQRGFHQAGGFAGYGGLPQSSSGYHRPAAGGYHPAAGGYRGHAGGRRR